MKNLCSIVKCLKGGTSGEMGDGGGSNGAGRGSDGVTGGGGSNVHVFRFNK